MFPLKHLHVILPTKKGVKCTVCQKKFTIEDALFQWAKCINCGEEVLLTQNALNNKTILCLNCRRIDDPVIMAAELNLLEKTKEELKATIERQEEERQHKLKKILEREDEILQRKNLRIQKLEEAKILREQERQLQQEQRKQERLQKRKEVREKRMQEKEEKAIAKAQLKLSLKGITFTPQKTIELLSEEEPKEREDLL